MQRSILESEQGKARRRATDVVHVRCKNVAQMAFVKDNDVVQALPPDRTEHALDVGVLPRAAWCRGDLRDAHRRDPLTEDRTIRGVAVAQRKVGSSLPRESFNDLLRKPRCRGMLCNIEPHDLSAASPMAIQNKSALPIRRAAVDEICRRLRNRVIVMFLLAL